MTNPHRPLALAAALALLLGAAVTAPAAAEKAKPSTTRWLKIRVYEHDSATPTVLVNLPIRLASAAVKLAASTGALDHGGIHVCGDTDREVRLTDLDMQALLKEIETMEPGQIIEVRDGGERVTIWVE